MQGRGSDKSSVVSCNSTPTKSWIYRPWESTAKVNTLSIHFSLTLCDNCIHIQYTCIYTYLYIYICEYIYMCIHIYGNVMQTQLGSSRKSLERLTWTAAYLFNVIQAIGIITTQTNNTQQQNVLSACLWVMMFLWPSSGCPCTSCSIDKPAQICFRTARNTHSILWAVPSW